MKNIFWIIGIVLVLVGGFFLFNNYIYEEKQAEVTAGEMVETSGTVIAVNLEQIAFDGPYLINLETAEGMVTVAVPSMGLPLCAAYQAGAIAAVDDIEAGAQVSVRGTLAEDGSIVPCESEEDYLRVN